MIVNKQEVYDYLGIDYEDDMVARRISALISTVESYLSTAIGTNYATSLSESELSKAKEISLMLIGELYESRTVSQKERAAINNLYKNILQQLQLELEGINNESI